MMRSFFISVRSEIMFDHLSILHDKPDTLELGDIGEGISRNGHEIGEFPWLNCTYAVLPTQHFRGVGRNGSNHLKRAYLLHTTANLLHSTFLCNETQQLAVGERRGLCRGQCLMAKQQAVCATVSKTPPMITAANSDVRRRLAARCAGCPDPTRRANRWLRSDKTDAWRNIASSGTASLASAETRIANMALAVRGSQNSQKLPAQNLSMPLMPGREKKRNTVKSVKLFAVPDRLYIAFSGADRFDGGH
jgi:hypothetical protein